MRISDWSSDVCSSDLLAPRLHAGSAEDWLPQAGAYARLDMHYYEQLRWIQAVLAAHPPRAAERAMFGGADMRPDEAAAKIGRASCRERVCQYVWISVVAVAFKKKKK